VTKVLLTGFEPFNDSYINPSWEAVRLLAAAPPTDVSLSTAMLPCVFAAAVEALRTEIDRVDPELVVCVGQAGGRPDITVERVAINVNDARIPDNVGDQPIDTPVVPGGPVGYFATLPVKACVAALRDAGIPASVSQTAGTFVCNQVFYGLMHLIATERPATRGGFVHVPFAPEQTVAARQPSMPTSVIAQALRLLVSTAAAVDGDVLVAGGAIN
jgi:pyroglutamyl-peptidase